MLTRRNNQAINRVGRNLHVSHEDPSKQSGNANNDKLTASPAVHCCMVLVACLTPCLALRCAHTCPVLLLKVVLATDTLVELCMTAKQQRLESVDECLCIPQNLVLYTQMPELEQQAAAMGDVCPSLCVCVFSCSVGSGHSLWRPGMSLWPRCSASVTQAHEISAW